MSVCRLLQVPLPPGVRAPDPGRASTPCQARRSLGDAATGSCVCGQGWWRVPALGRRGSLPAETRLDPQLGLGTTGVRARAKGQVALPRPGALRCGHAGRAGGGTGRPHPAEARADPGKPPGAPRRSAPAEAEGRSLRPASRRGPGPPGFAAHLVGRPGCPGAGSPGWGLPPRPPAPLRSPPAPRAPRLGSGALGARASWGAGSRGVRARERPGWREETSQARSGSPVPRRRRPAPLFRVTASLYGSWRRGTALPARAGCRTWPARPVPAQAGPPGWRREQRLCLLASARAARAPLGSRHPPPSARGA